METSDGQPWPDQGMCTVLHNCKERSGSDLVVCFPFETGFHYVAQVGLELDFMTRLRNL